MDTKLKGEVSTDIDGSPQRLGLALAAEGFLNQLLSPGSPGSSRVGLPTNSTPLASRERLTLKARSSIDTTLSNQKPPDPQAQKRRTEFIEPAGTEPPLKRPRAGTKQTDALMHCQRSAHYWYLDGSVIIQVKSSLFKLIPIMLSRNSLYFKRLFEDKPEGNVSTSDPAYVEIPVFKLTGIGESVTAEDFEKLLWAVENAM